MTKPELDMAALAAALEDIRPRLRGHAGDVSVRILADGVIDIAFIGACHSCPSLPVTFAGLVRNRLMTVPGVRRVVSEQVNASPRALDRIGRLLASENLRPPK